MKNDSLFEITEKLAWLEDMLDEADSVGASYNEGALDRLTQFLDDTATARDEKLDSYAWLIRKLQAQADACQDQIDEWSRKLKSRQRKIDWLKSVLLMHLQAVKQKKVETSEWTFTVCANGGQIPLDVDESKVPEHYFEPQPAKLNMQRLRDDWMVVGEIEGVYARERGHHLRIR